VPDAWRITNFNDLVPTVPRLMGYSHVRHGVRLTPEGRLVFETEGLADLFGEGRSHVEVLSELLGQVRGAGRGACWGRCGESGWRARWLLWLQAIGSAASAATSGAPARPPARPQVLDASQPWSEVTEAIAAQELAVLDNLVGGSAMEEHMETFYMSTLRWVWWLERWRGWGSSGCEGEGGCSAAGWLGEAGTLRSAWRVLVLPGTRCWLCACAPAQPSDRPLLLPRREALLAARPELRRELEGALAAALEEADE
jgi:hypothetical protein